MGEVEPVLRGLREEIDTAAEDCSRYFNEITVMVDENQAARARIGPSVLVASILESQGGATESQRL